MNMYRFLLPAALVLLPTAASAQSGSRPADVTEHAVQPANLQAAAAARSWFDRLKALAGTWQGTVTTDPLIPAMTGEVVTTTVKVTSSGNAVMHQMTRAQAADNPLTIFYLEGDRLFLTHYCDSGNRVRMEGALSADSNTVTFEFVDLIGPTQHGHMNRAVFSLLDAERHVEEWTYVLPNGASVKARGQLHRVTP
jgi:hypothetical protein